MVAEKIRVALSLPFKLDGNLLNISTSIGIAIFPDHGKDGIELSKNADIAMYQAKKAGRNTIEIFEKTTQADEFEEDSPGQSIVSLIWKAIYASGEPTIDKEHRELFRLGNILLEKATNQIAEPAQFNTAFDALLAHVVEHFAHEELILIDRGYDGLSDHAESHHMLVESALKLRHQAEQSGISIGELVDFLVAKVVVGHMLKKDREFFWLFDDNKPSHN